MKHTWYRDMIEISNSVVSPYILHAVNLDIFLICTVCTAEKVANKR